MGSSLNVLLGVIPSTTGVGEGESDLNTGDDATGEETTNRLGSEEETAEEGRSNNEETGKDHHAERGLG
jgi:hypothetical protein